MKILITGGAGFIGSHLALRLIAEGHSVTVLDSLSPQIHGPNPDETSPLYASIKNLVRFVKGSVCDKNSWAYCLPGQDLVVHLAAETGTGQSMYEIHRYVEVNISGTALMLDFLTHENHQVRRVVVASSRAIYGEGRYIDDSGNYIYPNARSIDDMSAGNFDPICTKSGKPLTLTSTDEESKIHPTSIYGITKQNQEQMVMTVCLALGIEGVALRYQNVYGPGQSLRNPYTGILSIFSTRILNGNPLEIFEDGLESRDFIYIDDVVDATILALFHARAKNQIFGIGSGIPTNVLSLANRLIESYGVDVPVTVTGAFRVGDIRHNYSDNKKVNELLEFDPKTDFSTGLALFSRWVLSQKVSDDNFDKTIQEMKGRGLFIST